MGRGQEQVGERLHIGDRDIGCEPLASRLNDFWTGERARLPGEAPQAVERLVRCRRGRHLAAWLKQEATRWALTRKRRSWPASAAGVCRLRSRTPRKSGRAVFDNRARKRGLAMVADESSCVVAKQPLLVGQFRVVTKLEPTIVKTLVLTMWSLDHRAAVRAGELVSRASHRRRPPARRPHQPTNQPTLGCSR
jgi:hypothetical protein